VKKASHRICNWLRGNSRFVFRGRKMWANAQKKSRRLIIANHDFVIEVREIEQDLEFSDVEVPGDRAGM
jgi:hypothetical protein